MSAASLNEPKPRDCFMNQVLVVVAFALGGAILFGLLGSASGTTIGSFLWGAPRPNSPILAIWALGGGFWGAISGLFCGLVVGVLCAGIGGDTKKGP